ncbi:Centromere/kinetochore protein zw10 [Gaertneriomyces sp. JEL0708]|nr:Centromere/kinetochore protein zw10 [Gaertneriomyces sp. JEL0708]
MADLVPSNQETISRREREEMLSELQLLRTLSQLHAALQSFSQLIDSGDFVKAAESMMTMNPLANQLSSLQKVVECPADIIRAIKRQVLQKRAFLYQRLEELFNSAFHIASPSPTIHEFKIASRLTVTVGKTYFDTPISPQEVVQALLILGLLQRAYQTLVKNLEVIVLALIRSGEAQVNTGKTKMGVWFRIESFPNKELQKAADHIPDALNRILSFTEFLRAHICPSPRNDARDQDDDSDLEDAVTPASIFISIFSRSLTACIVDQLLTPHIPNDNAELEAYDSIGESVRTFDDKMKSIGMLEPNESGLTRFVLDITRKYGEKQRAELLLLVRDVLNSDDENTVTVPGDLENGDIFAPTSETKHSSTNASAKNGKDGTTKEGLEQTHRFSLPKMQISTQVQTLMELVHAELSKLVPQKPTPGQPQPAFGLDDKSKISIYYTTRDILDTFLLHASLMLSQPGFFDQPRKAAVFWNDCQYVVFWCLILGQRFRKYLPWPLDEMAGFVDLVRSGRERGADGWKRCLRIQRTILTTHLSTFTLDIVTDTTFETCETALKSALYHLSTLSKAWKRVLPLDKWQASLGLLTDVVVHSVLSRVMGRVELWRSANVSQQQQQQQQQRWQVKYLTGLLLGAERYFDVVEGVGKDKIVRRTPMVKFVSGWEVLNDVCAAMERAGDADGGTEDRDVWEKCRIWCEEWGRT